VEAPLVLTSIDAGVAVLTRSNPPLNLVTLQMTRQLGERLSQLRDDPDARVLIVRARVAKRSARARASTSSPASSVPARS